MLSDNPQIPTFVHRYPMLLSRIFCWQCCDRMYAFCALWHISFIVFKILRFNALFYFNISAPSRLTLCSYVCLSIRDVLRHLFSIFIPKLIKLLLILGCLNIRLLYWLHLEKQFRQRCLTALLKRPFSFAAIFFTNLSSKESKRMNR